MCVFDKGKVVIIILVVKMTWFIIIMVVFVMGVLDQDIVYRKSYFDFRYEYVIFWRFIE